MRKKYKIKVVNSGWFKSEDLIGNKFAKGHKPNRTTFKKGLRSSIKTEFKKGEMSKKQIGEKNSNWKGGTHGINLLRRREKIVGRKRPKQCELCGCFGKICFDHDHKTEKFRGWICTRCNSVLGYVKDNGELLLAMINYLNKNK